MILLATTVPADAARDADDDGWRFLVRPYLWAPRITGTLNFTIPSSGSKPSVILTPIDYLDNLNVPIMITGEVQKGAWSIGTDFVLVDFSGEKAVVKSIGGPGNVVEIPIDVGSTLGLRATICTLGGGYNAFRGKAGTFIVLGGLRYFRIKTTLDWQFSNSTSQLSQTGSTSETEEFWNGVVGIRGQVNFGGSHWFAPYYADIGTGSSDLTWVAAAGVGYSFGWGELLLTYRDLVFDDGQGSLVERLRLTGPMLGVGFRF